MKKFRIQAVLENCTGCMRCMLACSDLHTKAFNPSAARLQVVVSGPDCSIRFTDDCTGCGVCSDHCFYEALSKQPREAQA
ncbi:MAG: 4Fe-4S binding protein [Thermodesulfobacteriota bacterium]